MHHTQTQFVECKSARKGNFLRSLTEGIGAGARMVGLHDLPKGPDAVEEAMDSLNYALVMVNFRREPIYMSEAQMQKPENAHYLRSMERVPALRELRANFLGRVAHTSADAWLRGLEELLNTL